MKTNAGFFNSVLPMMTSAAGIVVGFYVGVSHAATPYVAHEWGTFTSVQGGDGVLLEWRPLQTSQLPGFVYDWKHPGLKRQAAPYLLFGKGGIPSLQRLETPVIYFYSKQAQTVDVKVQFPQGQITEWYPQATKIGPATVPTPPLVSELDTLAHKAGVGPRFTFASWMHSAAVQDSRAYWANLRLLPQQSPGESGPALLQDPSGSHYYAARDTDANYVEAPSLTATNPVPEHEKFVFYRGVGNFAAPLKVTMDQGERLTVANTGSDDLAGLFVLRLKAGAGNFYSVPGLRAGEKNSVEMARSEPDLSVADLKAKLSKQLGDCLVHAGLYSKEAAAMVHTWSDSWFQEDGIRVLYLLPRAWTDKVLPLTLEPQPKELVRVMVGRAEVLAPALEQTLTKQLIKASQGDSEARRDALVTFRQLGRFAEPALTLATTGAKPELRQSSWQLLQSPTQ